MQNKRAKHSYATWAAVPLWTFIRFGRRRSEDSSFSSSTSSTPHFDEEAGVRNIFFTLTSPPPLKPAPGQDLGSTPSDGLGPIPRAARLAEGTGPMDRLPSVASCCCRICQNSSSLERLISPCNCKGSLAYVHLSCLERWLNQSGRTYCELCQYQFSAVQTQRYSCLQSLRIWYSHPRIRRQFYADVVILVILSLVTVGLLAVTAIGMRYFVGEGSRLGISAFTTQGTILFFLGLVGIGYFITVCLLVRDQRSLIKTDGAGNTFTSLNFLNPLIGRNIAKREIIDDFCG
ncbi:hypothetical protein FOCC_FOCC001142, partial [Frankliniella occidentalis]